MSRQIYSLLRLTASVPHPAFAHDLDLPPPTALHGPAIGRPPRRPESGGGEADGGTRTLNLPLTRRLLRQLSYVSINRALKCIPDAGRCQRVGRVLVRGFRGRPGGEWVGRGQAAWGEISYGWRARAAGETIQSRRARASLSRIGPHSGTFRDLDVPSPRDIPHSPAMRTIEGDRGSGRSRV
jgi:hypothetical protein